MSSAAPTESPLTNLFTGADIAPILRERGWLDPAHSIESDAALQAWLARAAALLGPHAPDRVALADLLSLVFNFDAAAFMQDPENHRALAREGARDVIRQLANRVLDGGDVDSDRFKEIIDGMKAALPHRGRALFFPIRLALAGRTGEGELDRVILLLDPATKLGFAAPVKGTRERMLDFCAALD